MQLFYVGAAVALGRTKSKYIDMSIVLVFLVFHNYPMPVAVITHLSTRMSVWRDKIWLRFPTGEKSNISNVARKRLPFFPILANVSKYLQSGSGGRSLHSVCLLHLWTLLNRIVKQSKSTNQTYQLWKSTCKQLKQTVSTEFTKLQSTQIPCDNQSSKHFLWQPSINSLTAILEIV